MKKLIIIFLSFTYLLSSNTSNIKKRFDGGHGWWWYEETIKNPETNETKIIEYKVSPAEKKKIDAQEKNNKLLQALLIETKETKKLNKKILERLIYAFPNTTPKYTTNSKTGKKCLTNSSMDCFVMPVITEGQHVPALKDFLRNPSPKNSKNWLQWQATYFNHVNKVSKGLRFAYIKDGQEAYPTATDYSFGDNLFNAESENLRAARERKIILNMKDDLAYLIFMGSSTMLEKTSGVITDLTSLNNPFMNKLKTVYIFPSKESLAKMDSFIRSMSKKRSRSSELKAWEKMKKMVRPDLYKKNKIRITPTVIVYYKNKKMENAKYQVIQVGDMSNSRLRRDTINFLEYNSIISPKERAADINWLSLDKETEQNKEFKKLPEGKIPEDFEKTQKKQDEVSKDEKIY